MQEHQPEYVLKLLDEDKLFDFLESYNVKQRILEDKLYGKARIKDKMTQMMVREWLMYQDLT